VAKKTIVTLVDDMDGTEAAETIAFAVDGTSYEIDLSSEHAAALREAIAPYVAAARRTTGRNTRSAASGRSTPKEIRAWAADHGVQVPARGRVPAGVIEQYLAATK
jgi:nucleoid-associated protein Lsr2